jgi:hypothetical protein
MLSSMTLVITLTFCLKLSLMLGLAATLHYLSAESDRLLPLRTTMMIAIVITLFSVVFPVSLWGLMMGMGLILAMSMMVSYGRVPLRQRYSQLHTLLNIMTLGIMGPLLAQNLVSITVITIASIVIILWIERRVIPNQSQPYQMVCQVVTMSTLTEIDACLAYFKCKNIDKKMTKDRCIYLNVYYELSPLTQSILIRRLLQLEGVHTLTQY